MIKLQVGILKILFISTVSVIVIGGYVLWKHKNKKPRLRSNKTPIPSKWRQIGEVSKINLYPIKFGKQKSLDSALCTEVGLKEEEITGKYSLIDRSFVLFNEITKEILTVHNFPQMLHIEVKALDEDTVVFSSPGFDDFVVKVPTKIENNTKMVPILWFKENAFTIDCGEKACTWLTKIFFPKDKIYCRLGYNAIGVLPARWVDKSNWSNYAELDNNKKDDDFMGSCPDLVSLTVMTHAPLYNINSFLDEHVTVYNFLPNILVKCTKEPLEEDEWDWLKIGEDIVLRSFKYCTRDLLAPDPEKKELESQASIMGAYMRLHKTGVIKTGAPVFVNCCD